MSTAKKFEDPTIWQDSREFVKDMYTTFSGSKDYGFKDQILKAGVSIMNNIAEGFERNSDADFKRFLTIAKASCGEVRSMLYLAEDLGYMDKETADDKREQALKLSSGIGSLIRYLKNGPKT